MFSVICGKKFVLNNCHLLKSWHIIPKHGTLPLSLTGRFHSDRELYFHDSSIITPLPFMKDILAFTLNICLLIKFVIPFRCKEYPSVSKKNSSHSYINYPETISRWLHRSQPPRDETWFHYKLQLPPHETERNNISIYRGAIHNWQRVPNTTLLTFCDGYRKFRGWKWLEYRRKFSLWEIWVLGPIPTTTKLDSNLGARYHLFSLCHCFDYSPLYFFGLTKSLFQQYTIRM